MLIYFQKEKIIIYKQLEEPHQSLVPFCLPPSHPAIFANIILHPCLFLAEFHNIL